MATGMFDKGDFQPLSEEFKRLGLVALRDLSKFQEQFEIYDTDTTINSIRDTIIADILGFDLVNQRKHGFDAKRSKTGEFLEVKQCSISAKRWGGTWNDTNVEKAKSFYSGRLYTAVAIWRGASDLQFIVFGNNKEVGEYLLDRVNNRKKGSRSTQNIPIEKLIKWGFIVVVPPGKSKKCVLKQLTVRSSTLSRLVTLGDIKTVKEL